jgi:hypothetical protein
MHYVTHRSHRMQKHMFNLTYLDMIFVESVPVPPEHEKLCVVVSHLGHTEMHYETRRSPRMQKHTFDVTCPDMILLESVPVPPESEK